MVIQFYGHSCFKITSGDLTIVTDPYGKEIGLTPPRFSADILTISHDHFDHNNEKTITGQPFVIKMPGEYEIKDIFIWGIESSHDKKQGRARGKNTIFVFEIEEIRVCHLGDLGQESLLDNQIEAIGKVDILMIPVGGHFTINAKEAAKITNQLAPHLVIPMHYKTPKLKIKELERPEIFLKEMAAAGLKPEEKIVIKKKDLVEEKTKVVLLKPLAS